MGDCAGAAALRANTPGDAMGAVLVRLGAATGRDSATALAAWTPGRPVLPSADGTTAGEITGDEIAGDEIAGDEIAGTLVP